ncbi:MAG: PAS domain-containing protein, partial [Desulfovibrionaceae bacterium]
MRPARGCSIPEALWRTLLAALRDPVLVVEVSGVIRAANQPAAVSLGRAEEEDVVGENVFDLLPAALAESRRPRLQEVAERGESLHFEDEHNGRFFRHSLEPVESDEGGVALVTVVTSEVTPLVRAEEGLRREQQRQVFLLESLPGIVFIIGDDYDIRYANRAFRRTFGSPKGRLCHQVLKGCNVPCKNCPAKRSLSLEASERWEWVAQTGQVFQMHSNPMSDEDGRSVAIVLGVDITARKRAEQELATARDELEARVFERTRELAASRRRYLRLIHNLPMVVLALKPDLSLDFVNDSVLSLLGYPPEMAVGEPDFLLSRIDKHDRDKARAALQGWFFPRKEHQSVRFRFRHEKGYQLHLLARPLRSDNGEAGDSGPKRAEGLLVDVTERTFLDQVLVHKERLNTLGALSAEIAHQIRNPVFTIAGFARRLLKKRPEAQEAEIILEESQRLEKLVNRIGEHLKPLAVSRKFCNINVLLSFSLDFAASSLARAGVSVETDLDESLPQIPSDPDRLTEVFVDLLTTIASSAQQPGTLLVRTHVTRSNVGAELVVREARLSLEHPETQFLSGDEEPGGLELAGGYRNVRELGGLLTYRSDENEAAFVISLPRGDSEQP